MTPACDVRFFAALVPMVERRLGFERRVVAAEWQREDGRTDVRLTSHHFVGPRGTEVKAACLNGPRCEIINLMGYPRNCADVPILAVEFIAFGQRPFVAVVDLQPAAGTDDPLTAEVVENLRGIFEEFTPRLSPGGPLPEWALGHFTPTCIFSRPQQIEEAPLLVEAFGRCLEVWADRFLPRETTHRVRADALAAYQQHHVEHTPGRKFLARTFGTEWTERYLREFMYCTTAPSALDSSRSTRPQCGRQYAAGESQDRLPIAVG